MRSRLPIWLLIVGLTAGAVLLWVLALDGHYGSRPLHLPWPVLALGFAAGHFAGIRVEFRKQSHILDLTDVVLLPAIVFAGPGHAIIAAVLGTLARSVWQRRTPIKATLNTSLHALAVAAGYETFHMVTGAASILSARGWLAAIIAVLAAEAITTFGIQLAISVSSRRLVLERPEHLGLTVLMMTAIDTIFGLVAVEMLWASPGGGVLFLAVATGTGLGFAVHGRLQARHNRLSQLHRFERALAGIVESDVVMAAVLHEAVTLLNAEVAQLVSVQDDRTVTHTLRVGDTGPAEASGPHPFSGLTVPTTGLLLSHDLPPVAAAQTLAVAGFRDAVIVPLPSDGVTSWRLVIADRLGGDHMTFSPADLALTEALATPTAMALRSSGLLDRLRTEVAIKQHQASHDSLTGLANRRLFSSEVDRILAVRPADGIVGMMLIDLDGFKKLNDTLGHEAGDGFLEVFARRLTAAVGPGGVVGRLGGDEFGVALPDLPSDVRIAELAEDIDRAVRAPAAVAGTTVQMRASIGVAVAPFHGEKRSVLLRQADLAMYRAKNSGGGVSVQNDCDDDLIDRFSLITALRQAVTTSAFHLHYQPKVAFATGRVTGVEALLRWTHPFYGPISPEQFVPAAEASGLIRPITQWVLETALAQLAAWDAAGLPLAMAVNLSPDQAGDSDVVTQIRTLLERHDVAPEALTLEITESGVVRDWGGDARHVLGELGALGVRLAIDDYGVGTSSLIRLKNLRVDELKVDKSFITHITTDPTDVAIVSSTINLAHQLGLTVTAEGIETQAGFDCLRDLGCDTAQGYLLSVPLPESEMTPWLHERFEEQALAAISSDPGPVSVVVPIRAHTAPHVRSAPAS
jgi:diguanylate cyclase (GGDEF)-like protein